MTKRRALFCATGLALLGLAACSMIPPYQRPAAPVAATYAGEPAASAPLGASDIEWQRFFSDERLKRLIAIALEHNRDLRVAVLNIEQARAAYGISRADRWPTLNLGASETRQPRSATTPEALYLVGFSVTSYELDFFGRVRSLNQAALAQYLASEEARKTAQISLIAGVANGYLSLQADDEQLALTHQTLATREDSLKLVKLKFDNGAASELDLRESESLLEAAKAALAALTRQRALDENALVLLLGQPVPADLPAGLPLAEQQLAADVPAGLPSELLERRPDLRQAEQQLIAANANIGAARAAFFPRISLTASAGTASTALSGLFKAGSEAWLFAPQALLPLFDAGRNQANLDLAKASREVALAQYEKAIQLAFREVSDALAGRATLGEQLRAQAAQAQAEQARVKLTELRYRQGAASYFELLDAQRAWFTAQQAAVQVQAAQVQNLVTLYQVLGGGWATVQRASD